jgi:hypothetical protein
MKFSRCWINGGRLAVLLALIFSLEGLARAQDEPTIISVIPPDMATGVSPSAPVIFTFSEAMDPDATQAEFADVTAPFTPLPTSPVWSAGNTVLTCTPMPAFPANRFIFWTVSGQNPNGDPLGGNAFGSFTTGGSGGGTGTNRITTFSLGTIHAYDQTSAAAATPDADTPYAFTANTILASNRTATAVTLTLPSSAVSNLMQNFFLPEQFFLVTSSTNLSSLNTTYANGNYTFNVQSAASNQQVTVNLPASLVQPNAPHVANFTAAQSVNPADPFTLTWDPFQNGTAADFISVTIGTNLTIGTGLGTTGALSGTATSVLIPAGTLQPGSSYDSTISFYRAISNTNNPTYATVVYRGTTTSFNLMTTGSSAGELVLTNATWTGNIFSFDVTSSPGQTLSVEYSSNMLPGQWQTLLTTNSPTGRVRITDPHSTTNLYLFYRARDGS